MGSIGALRPAAALDVQWLRPLIRDTLWARVGRQVLAWVPWPVLIHPCRGDPSSPKSHLQSPACRARQRSRFLFGSSGWTFSLLAAGSPAVSPASALFSFLCRAVLIDELVGNWDSATVPGEKKPGQTRGAEKRDQKKKNPPRRKTTSFPSSPFTPSPSSLSSNGVPVVAASDLQLHRAAASPQAGASSSLPTAAAASSSL